LLEIQTRRGQLEEAVKTATTLVAVSTSNAERAEALTQLARLERQNKQHGAAAHAYEQAVSLVGLEGGVAKEFKDLLVEQKLLGEDPRWDYYAGALEGHAEQSSDLRVRSDVYLEIARVLADEMGLTDRCLHTLQRAVAADPERVELRAELAMRLKVAGHHPQAVVELRRLLDHEIANADTWRSLVECFHAMQRPDEATLAMAPLCALGLANDLEQATVSSRLPRTLRARPGSFDDTAFRGVDARAASDPALGVLAAISEGLGKVQPPELERYGLTSRDRITTRSGHPLKALADRVASVFGQLEFDIYLHRAHQGGLEIELTDPPGILVPAHVATLREPEQIFLFARALALLARGAHALARLAPTEIELLLISAARLIEPTFGAGFADEDFLTGQSRRLQKSLSRARRKMLEEVAPSYMAHAKIDYEKWAFEQRRVAARAALVLADDLPGSIGLVRRTEGDLAGLRGAPLQQGIALVQDLLRFWVSDAAFALRRRLGIM
jgi:Tfp pilus assembly protein PilF